ncbi:hypothetical protein OG252_33175 [Streptomyces sp. NBC_01352]|uniref:hypothetical protein n=1 Tax=Streptomyces sp. NBC_01352 TaxID=2903834 RepID=UPI002E304A91|nr:hypothetical protein [Streptomyces sp. NBC_01352]
MTSHVEAEIQARIARVRAEEERKRKQREELARRRKAGVAARNARKLFNLANVIDNTTFAASGA